MDGRPGNEYFQIPHKISDLLTPLTPLGVRPQCLLIISLKMKIETDRSNSSQCGPLYIFPPPPPKNTPEIEKLLANYRVVTPTCFNHLQSDVAAQNLLFPHPHLFCLLIMVSTHSHRPKYPKIVLIIQNLYYLCKSNLINRK